MQQAQRCTIIAIDLGTSATTSQWALAVDSFNAQGEMRRRILRSPIEMRAWRGARKGDAIGNICLPTDLVYDRASKKLLCMGFQAQQYLDDPSPDPARETVFVVEHIKLLLNDPKYAKVSPETAARYHNKRNELVQTLGKDPYEVFEDFLDGVIEETIGEAKMRMPNALDNSKLELALAFPSGWPDLVHRRVAAIGARAVQKALEIHSLQSMTFGIQHVYTLSETLCGVKEWLTATIEEAVISLDLGPQTSNLDELNVSFKFASNLDVSVDVSARRVICFSLLISAVARDA
ncbi:hypothetical protein L207DRAFT_445996 [Hyaloscypha variabilis F]|uniref:Actin-like ATPase domain-containing protein n=1 Tax=Hyaloscypha variabilis (strain UAMH 11265 / GT02V1 / F) TaxID=1149755 RepID=A0A2J6QS63_HYAVF|nr:hypothetical protein L207DRAFT_445996 [Hyaloscypha variabilis F]